MSVVDLKHLRFVFGRNFIDIFIKLRVMPQIDLVLILLLHELLVPAFQVDGRGGGCNKYEIHYFSAVTGAKYFL